MATFGGIFFLDSRNGIAAGEDFFSPAAGSHDAWQPAADILEIEDGYLVQIDLPGVDAASIEVLIEGGGVLVHGTRRAFCPVRGKRYVHMEISRGEFRKAIALPAPISEEGAAAVLRDGVLEIRLRHGRRPALASSRLRVGTVS
ncbi:MAG: Hsp20/alpha crystallin family protein [Planctomycetota bacterium]|jgi:HSP20 family molecular chaperone IbpA|nr:Hsp20/alpha crystallin family protein [Planctomycetota bacterium]